MLNHLTKLQDLSLKQKRVMIREDFNVPLQAGKITSDTRLRSALPTIQMVLEANAAVILLSHLGRPEPDKFDPQFSLAPIANRLTELLNRPVILEKDWLNGITIKPGEIVLCENVRFNPGEKENDSDLAKRMARLCDIFVMDAFATAHRAECSTYGIAQYAAQVCAGPLLLSEIAALDKVMANSRSPLVAIVAGSKISTKLSVLENLSKIADSIIVGGGIANTFLAAKGLSIGKSLAEANLIETAKRLLNASSKANFVLPQDAIVAEAMHEQANTQIKLVTDIASQEMILDVGPKTREEITYIIQTAGTILWNGPIGAFEFTPFAAGTKALAHAIAASPAYCVAGGGDTLAAIEQFGIAGKVDYISTAGGAFLEYIEGKTLPAIAILQQRAKKE